MDIVELIENHKHFSEKQVRYNYGYGQHDPHKYYEFLDENNIALIVAIPNNYKGNVGWCGFLTYPKLKDTPLWFQQIVQQVEKEISIRDKKWKKDDPTGYRRYHPTFPLAKISTGRKNKKG